MRRRLALVLLPALVGLVGLVWLRQSRSLGVAGTPRIAEPLTPAGSHSAPVESTGPLGTSSRQPANTSDTHSTDAGASATHPTNAQLTLHVIGKKSRLPLSGVRVAAFERNSDVDQSSTNVEEQSGGLRTNPITGAGGSVDLLLPAGLEFRLFLRGEDGRCGSDDASVSVLRIGEHRTLEFELADGIDARVVGRVVDADSGEAVANAHLALVHSSHTLASSDRLVASSSPTWEENSGETWTSETLGDTRSAEDGRFLFEYSSWRSPHLRVQAAGFGVALVEPLRECSDDDHPLLIRLSKAGAIHARVIRDGGAPSDEVTVGVFAEGLTLLPEDQKQRVDIESEYPYERWSATAGQEGRIALAGLPANTELSIDLHMGTRVMHPEPMGLTLAPGETRELEWRIGSGCTLSGRILDQNENPVQHARIWLVPDTEVSGPCFDSSTERSVMNAPETDEDGRFVLEDVAPGKWLIGPAPQREAWEPDDAQFVAPVAEHVQVGKQRSMVLTLHVDRGLYIRGEVLDFEGKRIVDCQVFARGERCVMDGKAGSEGTFAIGPLSQGTYSVDASAYSGWNMVSGRVEARAGDSGLQLHVLRGGRIRGRVVDALTGLGCETRLQLAEEGSGDHEWVDWERTDRDGTFESRAIDAGSYTLLAFTTDGRFAVRTGIGVTAGVATMDISLAVAPGGKLNLALEGWNWAVDVRVTQFGVPVGEESVKLAPGGTALVPAPAGKLVLEIRSDPGSRPRLKTVELKAGETRDVVIKRED